VLKVSKFTNIVNRLFLGLVLTKLLIIPSTKVVSNLFNHSLNETDFISQLTRPINQEIFLIFTFIQDANDFSESMEVSKLGNRVNIEIILGYLIFISFLWESPIFFANYLILISDKINKANKASNLKKLNLQKANYLAPLDTVIWKQNPNTSSITTFLISKQLDFEDKRG
jgi:hypothetical protein